jgi:hypothetical protein
MSKRVKVVKNYQTSVKNILFIIIIQYIVKKADHCNKVCHIPLLIVGIMAFSGLHADTCNIFLKGVGPQT